MKFGKYLSKRHLDLPEYAQYFVDYKALKKLMKRLAARPAADNSEEARYERLQQNKSTFFFQLERELEKVTTFYSQKEADLETRLDLLAQKKQAAAAGSLGKLSRSSVAYISLHEGLERFRRDLDRLEQFVELNATAFAKVLKKWDKQSRSQTKELYLSRAVEVQPMFHRDVLVRLSDRCNACILEVESLAAGDAVVFEHLKEPTPVPQVAERASDDLFNEFVSFAVQYDATVPAQQQRMQAWIAELAASDDSSLGVPSTQQQQQQQQPPMPPMPPIPRMPPVPRVTYPASAKTSALASGAASGAASSDAAAESASTGASSASVEELRTLRLTQMFLQAIPTLVSDDAVMALWATQRVRTDCVEEVASRTVLHLCCSYTAVSAVAAAEKTGGPSTTKQITRRAVFDAALAAGGVDINALDAYGRTPLICAAIHNRRDLLQSLLAAGAIIDHHDNDNLNALHYSIFHRFLGCVEDLLNAGARTTGINAERFYVPLNFACQHGAYNAVVLLLRLRADPMVADAEGLYPLHIVARAGYASIIPLLVAAGASVNQVDRLYGWTPLMYAASEGHARAVSALLVAKADYTILDEKGRSALFYAAWEGHTACFKALSAVLGPNTIDFSRTGAESVPESKLMQGMELRNDAEDLDNATRTTKKTLDMGTRDEMRDGMRDEMTGVVEAEEAEDDDEEEEEEEDDDDSPNVEHEMGDIPELELPPPIMPLKRYGHNFLDAKKIIVQIRDVQIHFDKDRGGLRAGRLCLTSSSTRDSIPRNLPLPVPPQDHVQTFEVDHLDRLSLTFEVMPTFGTRLLAKAVAAPNIFAAEDGELGRHSRQVSLNMMNLMLRPVGMLDFTYLVVKPYPGQTLEISKFDTYWKSTAQQQQQAQPSAPVPTLSYVTASSLHGAYGRITVTLTRDLVPVLADMRFEIASGVSVATPLFTLAELRTLKPEVVTLEEWYDREPGRVNIHLPFPTVAESRDVPVRWPPMNTYVDRVLSIVFENARKAGSSARGLVFSSTHPEICAMLNWKQPNFPVLFCATAMRTDGMYTTVNHVETSAGPLDELTVCRSLREASIYAATNNLMGIIAPADVLRVVPACVPAIRATGLVLVADGHAVDGVDGVHRAHRLEFPRDIGM